ncbi:MAG: NERD domain-containing protein [Oscillatoriophycideae cyanobacterium NC_groundwater_1537_Pr4_S-0.65um_50_18]|nr:NERD domain-containing protein [Oscillatoriophycideae cyanobacterium NC_groundwater_1537_Pr4_S-0.65um_50_18]
MAILLTGCGNRFQTLTPGERRLSQRLQEKLDDDALIWFNAPIGRRRLHPDFIVLHPSRGLLVLEVKDWHLDTIEQITPATVTLLTPDGQKEVENPLEQARGYVLAIKELLERDPLLVQSSGRYQGHLAFPYSYGVVLSHITRRVFESQPALVGAIEPNLVLCKDEMTERVDAGVFQQQLWNFCPYEFGEPLTAAQIDRIRWHIFPELRPHLQLSLLEPDVPEIELVIPDLIEVMDLQQEQLARCLGDGHRIIHGVAGSGKTLILAYRCQRLLEEIHQPILVLCFNVPLAARLRQMLHARGIHSDRISVRHFHRWCAEILQAHHIANPNWNQFQGEAYLNELVGRVMRSLQQGLIPAGQYGAVLVDEGHDFQPDWLKLVVQMISPDTQSLLLLYDDAQNLYGNPKQQKFSFKSVGIQAQGRTTILKVNYRNTAEVLAVAYAFAQEFFTSTEGSDEDAPVLIQPQTAGRRGIKPELIRLSSFRHEVEYLAQRAKQLHERGTPWQEMAILYRSKFMAEQICRQFEQAQLPIAWVSRDSDSRNYDAQAPSMKLITMHSSKGLEFSVVFVPGIGFLPHSQPTPAAEARLLYVAMTRAIDQLIMTCDRSSAFVSKVSKALQCVQG